MSDNNVPVVNVTVGDTTYPAGVPLPKDVAKLVTNPKVFGGDPSGQVEDKGTEVSVYADLKGPDLKAEIERRNADRADDAKITVVGKKNADMIAALEADDAAHDEGDDSDAGGE
jgi:hypothetical protein